jgi:hypothetical protein
LGYAQRHALVFGGILACMIGGLAMFAAGARRMDWIGKALLEASAAIAPIAARPAIARAEARCGRQSSDPTGESRKKMLSNE